MVLRRWMMQNLSAPDSELTQRRQLYRQSAKHMLINDVEAWWDFHAARNMTSHTYNEANALAVAAAARTFNLACKQLINGLKAKSTDE